ncbi:hypothetical protein ABGB18_35285 [Nonomuraea sp. B12E4]|uniref:hypothetical protein n=1 Tax=Nonomuraea sp. B12E4 TaxID=3153564 RepID=UPI00325C3C9F
MTHQALATSEGMEPVVQGATYRLPDDAGRMWGMVDAVGRFEYDGLVGHGLLEYWALGPHPSFPERRSSGRL